LNVAGYNSVIDCGCAVDKKANTITNRIVIYKIRGPVCTGSKVAVLRVHRPLILPIPAAEVCARDAGNVRAAGGGCGGGGDVAGGEGAGF
jgi:hypothetical protein